MEVIEVNKDADHIFVSLYVSGNKRITRYSIYNIGKIRLCRGKVRRDPVPNSSIERALSPKRSGL